MIRRRALVLVVFSGACASVSPERGHDQVAAIVAERTGHKTRWEKGPPEDGQIAQFGVELGDLRAA